MGPDVGGAQSGGRGKGWNCVDYEAPFLVWLEAVEGDVGEGGEEKGGCGAATGGER